MRVVVLTGVRLFGECLEAWFDQLRGIEVVGVARDLRGLPDLVLVDVTGGADLGEIGAMAAERPEVRLVALGLAGQRAEVLRCAKAGFRAYIARDTALAEFEPLLLEAAQGRSRCPGEIVAGLMQALFRPDLAAAPAPSGPPLIRREGQILRLIGRGHSNKEIARELTLSAATVKNHVHNVLTKLGLSCRNEAMRRVRDEPWLSGPGT